MRINLNSRNVTDLMNEIELPTITLVLSLVLYLPAGTSRCSGVDLGVRRCTRVDLGARRCTRVAHEGRQRNLRKKIKSYSSL